MAFLSEKCVNDITIGPGWRMLKVLQVESTLLGFPTAQFFLVAQLFFGPPQVVS
jgi:hypothetical protein